MTDLLNNNYLPFSVSKQSDSSVTSSQTVSQAVSQASSPSNQNVSNASRIVQFYKNRSIFITGATGFMGKVLVEKLLRSCPDIKHIYILVRGKRGVPAKQRVQDLLNTVIFDKIKENNPSALQKIVPIEGDITLPNLGITATDFETLINDVSIVFHSAATVNFNEPLKDSVRFNVIGTKMVVELCQHIKHLIMLTHVSTAYANCHIDSGPVDEKFYAPPMDPNNLISLCEWMDSDIMNDITRKLLGDRPNTYTFTKSLAEHLIYQQSGRLPVVVVRPSIVASSFQEPLPGWVDNVNGPTGIILACGKGLLRTMYNKPTAIADIIPVDFVINLIIAAAWHTAEVHPNKNEIPVYNCCTGTINPLFWGDVERLSVSNLIKYPSAQVFRHPGGSSFKETKIINQMCVFYQQLLPVYLFDFVQLILGKKRYFRRLYAKIESAVNVLEYFTTRQWYFKCSNVIALQNLMSPAEREMFFFDFRRIDWEDYWACYVQGCRKYVLKEDDATYPQARENLKRIKLYTNLIKVTVICIILIAIWKWWF